MQPNTCFTIISNTINLGTTICSQLSVDRMSADRTKQTKMLEFYPAEFNISWPTFPNPLNWWQRFKGQLEEIKNKYSKLQGMINDLLTILREVKDADKSLSGVIRLMEIMACVLSRVTDLFSTLSNLEIDSTSSTPSELHIKITETMAIFEPSARLPVEDRRRYGISVEPIEESAFDSVQKLINEFQ